jgi:RNA polymerase sigma-70 factor (ECF subfamily)
MSAKILTALTPLDLPAPPMRMQAVDVEVSQAEHGRPAGVFDDLESIVAAHEVRIYRFLYGTLRDRDLAQTLTQETLLRAWSARDNFRGECATHTWLMRIAVNLVRDHTRTGRFKFWKKAATQAVEVAEVSTWLPQHGSSAEAALIARQEVEKIWETVGLLSEKQRAVFLLRFVEELDLPEIAETMAMPVSTVKSHLYRALHTVRSRSMNRLDRAAGGRER